MKVARVSIIENTSEKAVYSLKNYHAENFKKVFPTAERTWVVKTGPTSSLTFTIYPNQTDADATSSGRREFLDSAKEKIADDFSYVGEVICELENLKNSPDVHSEDSELKQEVIELKRQLKEKSAIIDAMKALLS